MANFQPKIYSLSTLNVRQHFNCDYKFNDFRTDFSGESGSGKSLIADFIQLLLVGSKVFKSGTEGIKQRDTSGLALKNQDGKYGRGYIFINVEVQPKKYIVLGGYLETTSSQMHFFIIQSGYDFEEALSAMNKPIFYRDLLVDGKIETLQNLEKVPLDAGYLKGVSNKKYHQLLFNNGLLAVDLSQNVQSLKSYAAIIRSFSRGKGFFTDSDALKKFLFGDDDQKRLFDKYQDDVQNINLDQQQHHRLVEEIATIKDKELKIERVLRDFENFKQSKMKFSLENASFWFKQNDIKFKDFQKSNQEHQAINIKRLLIKRKLANVKLLDIKNQNEAVIHLKNEIRNTEMQKEKLISDLDRAKKLLDDSTKYKDIIEKVNNWFTNNRSDLDAIRQWYLAERSKINDVEALRTFENFLRDNNLQKDLEKSDWFNDYSKAGKLSNKKLTDLELSIEKLEVQLVFSDLDNPASLANWAIEYLSLPLSLEQESLLIHFQSLSRIAPVPPKGRFLPFPEKLFKKPITTEVDNGGFWLELNGIYEFIMACEKQYLNVAVDQIKLNKEPLEVIRRQLEELKEKYISLKKLKENLESYPALEKMLFLYKSNQDEIFTEIDEIAELTSAELEKYISIFENSEKNLENYVSSKELYDIAYENLTSSRQIDKTNQEKITEIESNMRKQYGSIDFEKLEKEENAHILTLDVELENLVSEKNITLEKIQNLEEELFNIIPSFSKLYQMANNIEVEHNEAKIQFEQCQEQYSLSIINLNEARTMFMAEYNRDFNFAEDLIEIEYLPKENVINESRSKFEASYEWASSGIEDKIILKDYSVGILAHKLLPTVFPTQQIQEDLIGEQIEKRLTELTNDLQHIGSRKIEILHNVFNEVQKIYNDCLTNVQRITKYLANNQITGGNYATLQHKPSPGYPDDWMKIFRKRLTNEMQDVGIFASSGNGSKQDIDEIMINVFREANGTREAKVQDLLNPLSYFDLLFDIKLEDGQSNSGSNGQTYTANALLCLARLSLIEDKDHSGIRIMPIDEAEGLGSNYEMLHKLAKKENYQIVSMSIETAGDINDDGQYIYIMQDNKDANGLTYVPPLGIFHNGQLTENINEIFEEIE